MLEAKEEIHRLRAEQDRENRERRNELSQQERRLVQKEEVLDQETEGVERREEQIARQRTQLESMQQELEETLNKQRAELERISGLTTEDAKDLILTQVREEVKHETAKMIKEIETQAKEEAEKELAMSSPKRFNAVLQTMPRRQRCL